MAVFSLFLSKLLSHEGGFVDHPKDPGGATNLGITFATFKRFAKSVLGIDPTLENLKNLTIGQAGQIYKTQFWDRMKASDIHDQGVAEIVFDFYVNATSVALPMLQQILNWKYGKSLVIDGLIGPKTITAINSVNADRLHDEYKKGRLTYYKYRTAQSVPSRYSRFFKGLKINPRPDQIIFFKGWMNRTLSFADRYRRIGGTTLATLLLGGISYHGYRRWKKKK